MKKKAPLTKLLNHNFILVIYILAATGISLQLYSRGYNQQFNCDCNGMYTSYNNYIIFKQSFFHLLSGKDMYILYTPEYFDLYKYSPSFALWMGALAWLPDALGLILWNVLNAIVLFYSIKMLPLGKRQISYFLLFIIIELITSLQNSQSNAMMAGLMIASFGFMERDKPQWATLLLVVASFIKIYGAAGFALFLFYPQKPRFILYAAIWTVIIAAMPLLVTPPETLLMQYQSWGRMLQEDQAASYGLSVMGWLNKWFGIQEGKNIVTLIGALLFFLPFTRIKMYQNQAYRLLTLGFILIWVIIFNHKAESATFIIAVCGICVWYFARPATKTRTTILWMAFVFVCLSATDLMAPLRKIFLEPYAIKPFACIVIWCIASGEIMTLTKRDKTLAVKQ